MISQLHTKNHLSYISDQYLEIFVLNLIKIWQHKENTEVKFLEIVLYFQYMFYSISSMGLMEQIHDSNNSPSAVFISTSIL